MIATNRITEIPASADLLGEIVAWQMPATEVSFTAVKEALTAAGLDEAAARELKSAAAFRRASKGLKESRQIDKVTRQGNEILFQLTHVETRNSVIEFDFETQISLDVETGDIRCEDGDIEQRARDLFAHAMETRTANDITRLVQGMFGAEADLYAIVPSKGVAYFVPEQHRAFTQKIDAFLSRLGGMLHRFPVPRGTTEGNKSVQEAVNAGLAERLAELESAVDDWGDSTRESTMERALERWQIARHKVEAYAEFLGVQQEALIARADAIKAKLVAKIEAKQADIETVAA